MIKHDPDAHGQAALMLCESLLLLLVERGVLDKETLLDAMTNVIEVKQDIAGTTESYPVGMASIGLLRAIVQSISAATVASKSQSGR